ncbi:MAG TPA: DUF2480 family protein [Chitinophagales bacterium]|nr:DUF2480 family protein [Chitinophagales bacterium]
MESTDKLVNRVADSGLLTIDLEEYYPAEPKAPFDLKDYLFMGLILKEKDYREALKIVDWEFFRGKNVAVFCSADAIVPVWAYMLAAVYLEPVATRVYFCKPEELDDKIFEEIIAAVDVQPFINQRVIIKGCSDKPVPSSAYLAITRKLRPVARSLMYGEACSNVPLYKQKSAPTP